MGALVDLTGKRFGRLVAIRREGTYGIGRHKMATWLCKCDCGKETVVISNNLRAGITRSCGCLRNKASYWRMKAMNEGRQRGNDHDHVRESSAEAKIGT